VYIDNYHIYSAHCINSFDNQNILHVIVAPMTLLGRKELMPSVSHGCKFEMNREKCSLGSTEGYGRSTVEIR